MKLVKTVARISDKEMKGILPIHPYAALLLKHISSAFDSNQRSMFDFIKNDRGDEIKGFPECLEGTYTVIANMYTPSSMKQGVECGCNQKTAGTFLSGSPATKLETALEGAWKVDEYWKAKAFLEDIIKSDKGWPLERTLRRRFCLWYFSDGLWNRG